MIISGDWNSARTEIDHHNYTDWECYKPRTRQMINDGILEHSLHDPYRHLNLIQNATASSNGWTYTKGNKRSRLDYFLDKEALIKSIELVKKELDSKATEDPSGEKELAYLQEALKNLNKDEVQHAAREKSKETQYKASSISDKLSKPPGRRSTIKEIITEHEDDQGRTIQTMHRGQLNAQAQINTLAPENGYICFSQVPLLA